MLAMNRCFEISLPSFAQCLFQNRKTWLWLTIPFVYGLYFGMAFKPVLFNGILFSCYFNPHVGYADELSSNVN
jgi:hypothetical protein